MTNFEYNRRATQDDFLKQTNEVRDERRDVPLSDILDAPLLCLRFNEEWKSHILGAVSTLQKWSAWTGEDDDTNDGTRQITKFLAQDFEDCGGDCSIEILLADEEWFQDEYLPTSLGSSHSNTTDRNDALNLAYDGTPQSIGTDIPAGAPTDTQNNALCYALSKFVLLYCSEKICTIQSKNWLEVAWTSVVDAAESFYDSTLDQMLGVWSDNLFGCIVDVATALTALADTGAQETLACYLYDELKAVTMSKTNFDAAIDSAAITLSGNAQDIACVMSEDNSLTVYLNFLEGYNAALIKNGTDVLDCPCDSGTYRLWKWDFTTQGQGEWFNDPVTPGNGTFVAGQGWKGTDIGTIKRIRVAMNHTLEWVLHGMAITINRTGGNGSTNNTRAIAFRPIRGSNTGVVNNPAPFSGGLANGVTRHFSDWLTGTSYTNMAQIQFDAGVEPDTGDVYVEKIELLYAADFAKGGYLVNTKDMEFL